MNTLHEILSQKADAAYYRGLIPASVKANLQTNFPLRNYQQEAIGRFVYQYEQGKSKEKKWLFHMATGSGKTLVMAALMIYLYKKGYRNFLFFVNSNNIIEKTKDNFLNEASSKYLFATHLFIDGQQIRINASSNFQSTNNDDINIVFTTIQGLHSKLTTPKENNISYQDFEDTPIVLISDEAHHINADTKKNTPIRTNDAQQSWEATVNKIFDNNKDNLLLEFTATTDFSLKSISDKYRDKIIYDYTLRQFRKDGFSKDVAIFEAENQPLRRALAAILLSQYRKKLFLKNGLSIKPVLLFKSKTIRDSLAFQQLFETGIDTVSEADLQRILTTTSNKDLQTFTAFLKKEKFSLTNLVQELQQDFAPHKLLSVNSSDDTVAKQLAVNSLEDSSNTYRAVFAVDKLNEGWDVLNLFDIVKLYDTKDASSKTTMAEAQLIGRGARYCPFSLDEKEQKYKRKYDHQPAQELQLCERLYYHCSYQPSFIAELDKALVDIGIKAAKGEKNEPLHPTDPAQQQPSKILLKQLIVQKIGDANAKGKSQSILSSLPQSIVRKAINKHPFFQFAKLKQLFPELISVSEFLESDEYLGDVVIAVDENDVEGILKKVTVFLGMVADSLSN